MTSNNESDAAGDGVNEKQTHHESNSENNGVEPTELKLKIIRQVEFYFGDSNLPRDKFMLEQMKLDDGWIPMSTMLKFKRLARLTVDPEVIVSAMKHSNLVEVDNSGSEIKLRRSPEFPLPEFNAEHRKALIERSVYCKGFSLDSTLDGIMAILNPHGPPENILMRKYKDKLSQKYMFKGSVFVTFRTREEAQAFLDLKSVKVGDTELIRMWQNEYLEKKRKEVGGKKPGKNAAQKGREDSKVICFKKGATIHLTGDLNTLTREDIKDAFKMFDVEPSFITYNKGDTEAFIRLEGENSAQPVIEKLNGELKIADAQLALSLLEGEEEETYLKNAEKSRKEHMERCQRSKRNNRQGRKRKNRNEPNETPPQKKLQLQN